MVNKQTKILIAEAAAILVFVVLASYLTLTGFVVESQNEIIVEETIEIEVWANSYLELELTESEDSIIAKTYLDNGTLINEQEEQTINFYLNGYQPPHLKNKSLFNLSSTGPGTYNLEVVSQGSPSQYILPSTTEKTIRIDENGEITILEEDTMEEKIENRVEINKTEDLENLEEEIVPENLNCETFKDNVFWSSGYSNSQGSVNYGVWHPEKTCENCFVADVEIETRFLAFEEENKNAEGYVQISNPEPSICNNPETGTYEKYLAYETLRGESQKKGLYCGNNKNPNSNCGIEFDTNYNEECYGIKSYADPKMILDTFQIKYSICREIS